MSLEHLTLGKCVPQLESTFRSDRNAIASYLFGEGFIADDFYEEILDPRSTYSDAEKATKLVLLIMRKVKLESSNYYKFINHLRQDKRKYSDIVDILDAEYFGIRKLPAPEQLPPGQTVVNFNDLQKELSPIKDKWHNIGIGLKVSGECLDKFIDLTDPLLEVIVHWLKGAGDTPPSWDAVVITLKEPSISEAELADKIHRLYCDHRQEEMAINERKEQADSDITSELVKVSLKSNYHLSDSQKEFERYKLEKKTKEIKRHFARFLAQLHQHMLILQRDGTLDVSVVKSHMVTYDRKLKTPMSRCNSLQDIFEVLSSPEHSSFLDYELIKVLYDGYGSDKTKIDFINYKKKLQKFLESRVIEQSSEGEKSYAVVIDESITDEISDLIQLQNRVKNILGHKNLTLLRWENLNIQPKSSAHSEAVTDENVKSIIPSPLKAFLPQDEEKAMSTNTTTISDTSRKDSGESILQSSAEDTSSIVAVGSDSPKLDFDEGAVPIPVISPHRKDAKEGSTSEATLTAQNTLTGTGDSIVAAIDDSHLDIDDLGDVLDEVETLSSKWRLLSTKLRIKESSLDVIERNCPTDVQTCLLKALGEWLRLNYNYQRHGRPSWRRLAEAVKTLDCALFETIAKNHTC